MKCRKTMLNLSIQTNIDKMKTITDFVSMLIEELKQSGRYGTARSYSSSIKRLNALLSGEIFSKQLLLINTQLVTRLIKFFD